MATLAARPRTVEVEINYLGAMDSMPYFYARDHDRDHMVLEPCRVAIADARQAEPAPCLDREGFTIVPHKSAVTDFEDEAQTAGLYANEVAGLIRALTGADHVVARGTVLRFSQQRNRDAYVNSLPAGFVHMDVSRQSFA